MVQLDIGAVKLDQIVINQTKDILNLGQRVLSPDTNKDINSLILQLHHKAESLFTPKHHEAVKQNAGSISDIVIEIQNLLVDGIQDISEVFLLIKLLRKCGVKVSVSLLTQFKEEVVVFLEAEASKCTNLDDFLSMFAIIQQSLQRIDMRLDGDDKDKISDALSISFSEENMRDDQLHRAESMGLFIDRSLVHNEVDGQQPDASLELGELSEAVTARVGDVRLAATINVDRMRQQAHLHDKQDNRVLAADASADSQRDSKQGSPHLQAWVDAIYDDLYHFLMRRFPDLDRLLLDVSS
eukprot:COSAG02_NODE_15579_length_1158_cov_1.951841_1_plen_297_part_00